MKRIVLGACGILLTLSASFSVAQETLPANNPNKPAPQPTVEQQYSYAIGLNMGSSFRKNGTTLDLKTLMEGFQAGLTGTAPKFDQATCDRALMELDRRMRSKAEAQQNAAGAENRKLGDAFLAQNRTKPGVKATKTGLQYKVIKPGTGAIPGPNDTVRCNYRGTLIDGREFDASNGNPIEFEVRGVIPGWTEALQLMKVGAKWQLFIPADLAYGNQQRGPLITPGSTLVFDIELLGIK